MNSHSTRTLTSLLLWFAVFALVCFGISFLWAFGVGGYAGVELFAITMIFSGGAVTAWLVATIVGIVAATDALFGPWRDQKAIRAHG